MILFEVRDHLKLSGTLAVRDLATHFNITDIDAKSMLEHWVKKGVAQKLSAGTLCQSGCRSCSPNTLEIYSWKK